MSIKYCRIATPLAIAMASPMTSRPAQALDLTVQPRLESGFAFYELEQKELTSPSQFAGRSLLQVKGVTSSDVLPFIGGGASLFAGSFYLDISTQHYFSGSDVSPFNSTNVNRAGTLGSLATDDTTTQLLGKERDAISRTEWAIALGYGITQAWSVFAGYRQSFTQQDVTLEGTASTASLATPSNVNATLTGDFRSSGQRDFDYDGPFLGTSLTYRIAQGWLEGVVSGNVGVAFMDGTQTINLRDFVVTGARGQVPINPALPAAQSIGRRFRGDSVGVSVGVNWKGYTPVDGLSYGLGVAAYRYEFDNDSKDSQDLRETLVRFNVNLTYAFDI